VIGQPVGAIVTLQGADVFPPPGLHNPATDKQYSREKFNLSKKIRTTYYVGFTLDHDWEVVPGTWTMQI
jgi:hypothetical protein